MMRIANIRNNKLQDLLIDERQNENIMGSIYKGKIVKVLKGLNIVFVDIGLERPAFLYIKKEHNLSEEQQKEEQEAQKKLKENTFLMVQIVKDSLGKKSFCVSGSISLSGRYIIYAPLGYGKHIGVSRQIKTLERREHLKNIVEKHVKKGHAIVRTLAEHMDQISLVKDLDSLKSLWKKLKSGFNQKNHVGKLWSPLSLDKLFLRDFFVPDVDYVVVDEEKQVGELKHYIKSINPQWEDKLHHYSREKPLFDLYNIEGEINNLLKNKVELPSGATMVIEETEAAWVVDVNTGSAEDKKKSAKELILDTNLEAARELVNQIRLRNLGGLILVDFIDMQEEEAQKKVVQLLLEQLALDKAPSRVLGMSDFGIVQITRKRMRKSLKSVLTTKCPHCQGRGRLEKSFSDSD